MKMEPITNVSELQGGLGIVFADLYNRVIEPKVAKEMNNSAGKLVNSARALLELAEIRNDKDPDIPFLAPKSQKRK